ncbi:CHAD domain-containing protein [Aldersonia kunmingensis]|uniref:CHAD domain-containing protein n=1 Tax=Aldersonia kunmingensis TaxID=408066 RepID=UPI000831D919|nr:CHAD domain-containing protein [Aldersonia kunmingensis]
MSGAPAGPALVAAISLDADRLFAAEPEVRTDAYDSVHKMRVATRRLRSVLRSYRRVFDRDETDAIRTELRWLGEVLGVARDAEVRAARFVKLLDEQPAGLIADPLRTRLVTAERERYDRALGDIHAALDGERYGALRAALARLLATPPSGPAADDPDTEVCVVALSAAYRRVREHVRTEFAAAPDARIEALHDVRKSAKRLRYAAEAAGPTLGESAEVVAAEAKALQTVLGDHRDAIESQLAILAAADAAGAAHEDRFGYGLLYMAEEQAARTALAGYQPAIERLSVACGALGA